MARGAIKPMAAAREIENCIIEMVLEHVGVSDNFAGKRCQFCLKVIDQKKVDEMKGIKTRKSSCTPIKTLKYNLRSTLSVPSRFYPRNSKHAKAPRTYIQEFQATAPQTNKSPLISARLSRRS